jgi:uncharacterized membrane protein
MNAAHLHLILNHIPVLGTLIGLALLGWALLQKSEELKKVSLGLLIIVALLTVPAYLTGEPAEEIVENLPGVEETSIEHHEEAGKIAFAGILLTGVAAWFGLVLFRHGKPVPNWLSAVILVLSLAAFVLMARTANLGGLIRHQETRFDFHAPAANHEKPD